MTGGALDAVETEDESFDGGGGVWLPRCAGTQAVSAQRVPLAAGGGREGAAAAARTPNGAYAEFAKAIRNTTSTDPCRSHHITSVGVQLI